MNSYVHFFSEFQILESEFRFLKFSTAEFEKNFPTRIFGIKNGIGILLPMGVPEIGTENWNSQPRLKISWSLSQAYVQEQLQE
jgi:hypothetical protein